MEAILLNGSPFDLKGGKGKGVRPGDRLRVDGKGEVRKDQMSKGQTLQDPFLNTLRKEKVPVSIFLVNGIKLQGQIESFDQFVVLLKNSVSQMVYKHAISTVVPSRNVTSKLVMPHGDDDDVQPGNI